MCQKTKELLPIDTVAQIIINIPFPSKPEILSNREYRTRQKVDDRWIYGKHALSTAFSHPVNGEALRNFPWSSPDNQLSRSTYSIPVYHRTLPEIFDQLLALEDVTKIIRRRHIARLSLIRRGLGLGQFYEQSQTKKVYSFNLLEIMQLLIGYYCYYNFSSVSPDGFEPSTSRM